MFNKYNVLDSDILVYDTKNDNFELLKKYFYKYLTDEEILKIEKFQNSEDRILHLLSYSIPKIELAKLLNKQARDIVILREDNKRPVYKDYDYNFSVSHSGTYLAFVLDKKNVGLDIEVRQKRDLKALEFVATKDEILEANDFDDKYELWTFKEAYSKYLGKGIGRYLQDFNKNNIDCLCQTIFINHLVITLVKEK